MWLRPSWDSQYTRTETERATTPYYIDSVHRARYVSWCVTSVPSLVYRYSCTVLIETEHTQRLCRAEVTYHHRTLGLSASRRSGTHTHWHVFGQVLDCSCAHCVADSRRYQALPAPPPTPCIAAVCETVPIMHCVASRRYQPLPAPPTHPASRLYAKQRR